MFALFFYIACSDFILADPQGTPAFVPGSRYKTKFYSVVDESNQDSGGGMKGFFTGDMGRSDTIEAMLRRHNQHGRFGGSDPAKFRYHESSFTVNEQVAILGTAQPYNHQGCAITLLSPPSSTILTEEYFEANQWSENEKKSWEALTAQPSVVGSDDPKYFKGISVEDIPYSYSPFAFCAPVFYGTHQPPMMQQQGQPMQQQQYAQQPMQGQGQPMQQQQYAQQPYQMQGMPMQMQAQPIQQQQQQYGQQSMQGQPMQQQQYAQQPMQQQGQPMQQQQYAQQPMQQQGQPMQQQQYAQQPMQQQGQPMQQQQQQNYGPSTVAPMPQQQQSGLMPTVGVIPTVGPAHVIPTVGPGM
jgi:hypothetical protein